ncbi:AAA family ATPase [Mucilaginibacter mali]|uniref:AAA family ATPase n=1 Tax=Mucilaginibacter mali TaxID=2740462 RepID=A0A7D4QQG8_9SPHI|nr:ATP-binding protein [Mucilaginibacter mali]QKJ29069.1 AAA family ATPase [Mucilaginibacter mali]
MSNKLAERPKIFVDKVHLKGFKSIEDVTIDFKEGLNILIGKNGSGKSNFLELMEKVLYHPRGAIIFFDYAKIILKTNDNHTFFIEIERPSRNISYRKDEIDERQYVIEKFYLDNEIIFDSSIDSMLRKPFLFKGKKFYYTSSATYALQRIGYQSISPKYIGFNLPDKLEYIATSGTFTFEIEDLLEASFDRSLNFLNSLLWSLEANIGDNAIAEAKNEIISPEKIIDLVNESISNLLIPQQIIIDNIRAFSPIEDLRFNKNINLYNDSKRIIVENIKLEFKINGNWMPWSQLSDGTKRLFYIISEVTYTAGLILIEEPELGIHPHQFNLLMDFLKEQSEHKQILISTHAPKALDHLSPEELDSILIASYDLKKGTQIRHLTSKEITKAKKYMKEVGFFSDYWTLSDLEE